MADDCTFIQAGAGAVTRTCQDKMRDTVSVYDFIPASEHDAIFNGTSTYDCSDAFDSALATALCVNLDQGTYHVSRPIRISRNGQFLVGSGQNATNIVADPGFTGGTEILVFGNRDAAAITETVGGSGVTIDCSGQNIAGIGVFGVRDGSVFRSIRVKSSTGTHFRFGLGGNGVGAAQGLMSQGLHVEACHAVTTANPISGDIFAIDGVFESTFISCKALGGSTNNNVATGFAVGGHAETRAVELHQCAVGNLKNSDGTGSFGVRYSDWSQECWDQFCTYENISGSAVGFVGSNVSGITKPLLCRSLHARLYAPGTFVAGIIDPAYLFGAAANCYAGPILGYQSTKVWVRFIPGTGQTGNVVEMYGPVDPAAVIGQLVIFDTAVSASNMVIGYSSANTSRRRIMFTPAGTSYDYAGNGYAAQHNATDSSFIAGANNKQLFKDNSGNTMLALRGDLGQVVLSTKPTVFGQAWNSGALMHLGNYALWIDSSGRLRVKNGDPSSDIDGAVVGSQM